MTRARSSQISLDETPYYHCICRCVRRAFLCGQDHYSGQDYEHRRQWVVDRLAVLVEIFAIDLCAYAVMSNHYHVVLKVDRARAETWSVEEVAERWMGLFSGPLLVRRWLRGETVEAETLKAVEIVESWRSRLFDLGWFMKCLNEHLARKANEEDNTKGRFWESRYKSQALLDEKALLSCMAYVDLNPVRAGMAATPEQSEHTSIQQRSQALSQKPGQKGGAKPRLVPMVDAEHIETDDEGTLCRVRLMDYLQLVDATGRALREDKRGAISAEAADVLQRLGIDETAWLRHMAPRKQRTPLAMGTMCRLRAFAKATGRRWIAGQKAACSLG
ncbi:transposase [Alcanivorax sp. NBRC 102024]|uniref:transposase n=1 Tax=Alcanivorax sp. NBRC 102024 TaxID=1113895 RepID=UPI000789C288|nr:transposase [Alcanivorax sp. NBRC 102024]